MTIRYPVAPPTLADVAERAGVSRQTVSNAINNPDLLRADTLARVQEAIEELGYSPNRAARNLRTRSSHLIGLKFSPAQEGTANAAMDRLGQKYNLGIVSNIDDKLLGVSRRHLRTDLDLVVTAQQVRSYKPEPAHFKECARRIGKKKGWVHITSGHYTDVEPLIKMRVPVIWINRRGTKLDSSQKKPTTEVKNLRDAAKRLGC